MPGQWKGKYQTVKTDTLPGAVLLREILAAAAVTFNIRSDHSELWPGKLTKVQCKNVKIFPE